MSRLIYTVHAECGTCHHAQDVQVQMYDGWKDADVLAALGETPSECANCYEINWAPLLDPEQAQ